MEESSVNKTIELVVIGGSAGSLDVLLQLLPKLDNTMNFAVIIVLHRKATDDEMLAMLLSSKTDLPVKEVQEKMEILPRNIYIAPADYHLLIENNKTFSLDYSEKINYSRPSIDVTFQSAADVYKSALACILLSGANADGTEGCRIVQANGGVTIAQQPDTASVGYMPANAINANVINYVFNVNDIIGFLNNI